MTTKPQKNDDEYYRFHAPHLHLNSVYGDDWFARKAEGFARFFGTPVFLISQTIVVVAWILLNSFAYTHFDIYPFILLNLAFSLQAAYAAPMILLAQTRQADRDKAHTEADAQHREALAQANEQQNKQILDLLDQNTKLTELVKNMSQHIETLTSEMHKHLVRTP